MSKLFSWLERMLTPKPRPRDPAMRMPDLRIDPAPMDERNQIKGRIWGREPEPLTEKEQANYQKMFTDTNVGDD